jgi:hypothetical protein
MAPPPLPNSSPQPAGVVSFDADSELKSFPPVRSRHRGLKVIVWFFVSILLFIVVIILTPNVLGLIYRDIDAVDDSDLSLPIISIPSDQNAFALVEAAGKELDSVKGSFDNLASGRNWNTAEAKTITDAHQNALRLIQQAALRPVFQSPVGANPNAYDFSTILPHIGGWRTAAKLSNVYALVLMNDGKTSEAIEQASTTLAVGRKITNSQGPLIGWLVGLADEMMAIQTLQIILASSTPSSRDLVALTDNLQSFYLSSDGLIRSLKLEYYSLKHAIMYLAEGSTAGEQLSAQSPVVSSISKIDRTSFYFHLNESILEMASDRRADIAYIGGPCTKDAELEIQKLAPINVTLFVTPNAVGKILHDITAASLGQGPKTKICDFNLSLSNLRLAAAMKAYTLDTKKAPASLEVLVPKYISAIPVDPYSGRPLQSTSTQVQI